MKVFVYLRNINAPLEFSGLSQDETIQFTVLGSRDAGWVRIDQENGASIRVRAEEIAAIIVLPEPAG